MCGVRVCARDAHVTTARRLGVGGGVYWRMGKCLHVTLPASHVFRCVILVYVCVYVYMCVCGCTCGRVEVACVSGCEGGGGACVRARNKQAECTAVPACMLPLWPHL